MDQDSSKKQAIIPAAPHPRKLIIEQKFAPCMKVVMPDKTFVLVPVDQLSSDAKRQILVARAREFVAAQLERFSMATLTPTEVKDVVKAVKDLDELQKDQYVESPPKMKGSTKLGHGLAKLVQNAAQGAATGTAEAFMDKVRQMDEAAKIAAEKAKAIDV